MALSVRQANGTIVTKAALTAAMDDVTPTENKVFQYDGSLGTLLYEGVTYDGESTFEGHRKKAFVGGQTYRQEDIDLKYPESEITSVTVEATGNPATTLPAAGGTVVLIHGDNFSGATAAAFGGTSGTSFSVVDNQTIQVTTPAKAAGDYDVTVTDDTGVLTLTDGVTYV